MPARHVYLSHLPQLCLLLYCCMGPNFDQRLFLSFSFCATGPRSRPIDLHLKTRTALQKQKFQHVLVAIRGWMEVEFSYQLNFAQMESQLNSYLENILMNLKKKLNEVNIAWSPEAMSFCTPGKDWGGYGAKIGGVRNEMSAMRQGLTYMTAKLVKMENRFDIMWLANRH